MIYFIHDKQSLSQISFMIITQTEPFTSDQIEELKKRYEVYIKTVIDLKRKICSAGMEMHYEGEQILLGEGSNQSDIWGGGIDLENKSIEFNSFINIRPSDNNPSNEIQDSEKREEYERLTRYFFQELFK
jgi:hypothetical protein